MPRSPVSTPAQSFPSPPRARRPSANASKRLTTTHAVLALLDTPSPPFAMSSSATPSASASAKAAFQVSKSLKVVGIVLAVVSGVLIGSSFVFKKKGLLRSQAGHTAGEGVAYLKSVLWWAGMILMILGEFCNFAAYAFVEALVVTPLGALSVVISAILSSIFLDEKLTFFGWLGCALCIIGSTIIALNGPQEQSIGQIVEFQALFLSPLFVVYASLLILTSLVIIFYFGPKYGSKNMIWYLLVCSLIGGLSVSVTTGLGSAIVTSIMGDNQFKHWFAYFLLIFIAVTLVTEVFYLNKALALFNTAMVTPTYYVIFSFCSMVTTVVLFKGLKASAGQILTIVMAFLVICVGITILQMSKVDPTEFKLDRRSTLLLQAARKQTEAVEEKSLSGVEDPGIDALRGNFGAVGSVIRARSARRMSKSSHISIQSSRLDSPNVRPDVERAGSKNSSTFLTQNLNHYGGMKRHQLFDPPVTCLDVAETDAISLSSRPSDRKTTIKFGEQDVIHSYHRGTAGKDGMAIHERRTAPSPLASPGSLVQQNLTLQESLSGSRAHHQYSPDTANPLPTPRFALEGNEPHSAPPVGVIGHPYHDPFNSAPPTAPLPSFPSAASSDDVLASRHHRHGSSRDYPKGDRTLDAEERVSLWDPRRQDTSEEMDVSVSPESPYGTVRLVSSSRQGRF
ncbi:magnesium transporter NIPA-domain-containing protein [Russula earlei]|uniref:Magnesium transporter NIPA-domain-containing protein n=1 Tax=Russula earlei TaxID=71964 RepID=A0ACC0U6B2_9AGAM|nr:magnesium transporter NIPA-domain-containing protein [Russula earlei]